MQVTCNNCGGQFDDAKAKCPYCGMIYEPGAEKEYNERLEDVRKNLDVVDDIVVTNFRADLRKFFIVFGISLSVVLTLTAFVVFSKSVTNAQKRSRAVSQLNYKLSRIALFDQEAEDMNGLFEEGNYDELYVMAEIKKSKFPQEIQNWSHYGFYKAYERYVRCRDFFDTISNNEENGSYELSYVMSETLSMYVDANQNPYSGISFEEREIINGLYEEMREKTVSSFDITDEDYEELMTMLIEGKKTQVSRTDCESAIKERLGE